MMMMEMMMMMVVVIPSQLDMVLVFASCGGLFNCWKAS